MGALMEPISTVVTPETGGLASQRGPDSGHYSKKFADLDGLYQDRAAFAAMAGELAETVVYEVHEHRPSQHSGDIIFGTSSMMPGRVGREYFMTRGHLHARSDRPEIYYCQSGHGVMLMEWAHPQARGRRAEVRAVEMRPQTLVYVPPHWIHRSVNVGNERLVTVFCYPADAGQDYECIRRAGGMKWLVVADGVIPAGETAARVEARGDGWCAIANPRYRANSDDERDGDSDGDGDGPVGGLDEKKG